MLIAKDMVNFVFNPKGDMPWKPREVEDGEVVWGMGPDMLKLDGVKGTGFPLCSVARLGKSPPIKKPGASIHVYGSKQAW
jgi:hypothetical protein